MGDIFRTRSFIGVWVLAVLLLSSINGCTNAAEMPTIFSNDFPADFVFGAGSAAYQVEGAAFQGGRGTSIWDIFAHIPGKTIDAGTGDIAVDQYHRYEGDLRLLKSMGMDAYRFSISWSRIFPNGAPRNGKINAEGVAYYNRLINAALAIGIQPYVTLFHWDVPASLEYEYGGFRNQSIVRDFLAYARTCFSLFGDRVKHWTTLNEPWMFAVYGYDLGLHAPGRCSLYFTAANNVSCLAGNSGVEPYTVAHNLLLAHSAVAGLYKRNFQSTQGGVIGITLLGQWYLPYNSSEDLDKEAALRMVDFFLGWFLDPLTAGRYPDVMREYVKNRLPVFNPRQSLELQNSLDFLGINYYTSQFAASMPNVSNPKQLRYTSDALALATYRNASGDLIGDPSGQDWLHVYPEGIYHLLRYATARTPTSIPIYITENGYPEENNSTSPIPSEYNYDCGEGENILPILDDKERVAYYEGHLSYIRKAMSNGSNVKGYFGWSLTDSFEWNGGYAARFGLHYVDYMGNLNRYLKRSACWFRSFIDQDKLKASIKTIEAAGHSKI